MPYGRKRKASRQIARSRKRMRTAAPMRRIRRPLPMRPRTYNFTRSFVENVSLNTNSPPTGWTAVENGLVRSQAFDITLLPDNTEFTSLFAQYRLMAVKQEFYFAATSSGTTVNPSDGMINVGNRQIMMYMNPNPVGQNNASSLTENFFMQSQVCKKRLCLNSVGRPVNFYKRLNQLSAVFSNELGVTDYAKIRPKFVSTAETQTQHYGFDTRIQRVDGNGFSTGGDEYPTVKIVTKVYLQCRQVH